MRHRPGLDGVRALAALAVLLFHARAPGFSGGFVGVDVFFVLSGYLITSLLTAELERTGRIDLGRFYLRRALRLVPALALLLVVYMAVAPWLWPAIPTGEHVGDVVLSGLYLSDYAFALFQRPHILRHTWSLAVEAQFYLLWPLAVAALARNPRRVPWMLALYLAASLWRVADLVRGDVVSTYYRADTHASGLLLGALLAWSPARRLTPATGAAALFALACLCLGLRWGPAAGLALGVPAAELAAAVLILAAGQGPVARFLSWRPLAGLGALSYGVYLWHAPIAIFLWDRVSWPVALAITLPLSVGMAALSWFTVERVGRSLKNGLPRPAPVAA
jgi:peptidoglycan/LPS O-acetylase OafA/YrhL